MHTLKKMILCIACLSIPFLVSAQEDKTEDEKGQSTIDNIIKDIQISAYFQGQYQYGQKDVYKMGVGDANESYGKESFDRLGLRRAYVSTMYQTGLVYGLITLEIRDRSIWFSDAFINLRDPWNKGFSANIGSYNLLFGYEMSISPSKYELPNGTGFLYNLLPDGYDIGAQVCYQAPEEYASLNVNAALVAGNGVYQETDSKKDFVGSIRASSPKNDPIVVKGGVSYYRGFVYQGTDKVYKMDGPKFSLFQNPDHLGDYAKRQYFDVNAQLIVNTSLGKSELRGEYVWGTQPGGQLSNSSPNSSTRPAIDTYVRDFRGGYIYYLQQLGKKIPLQFFGGYCIYDPNTKVSGDEIGLNNTSIADVKYQTATVGLNWYPYPPLKVQAFYEMPFNEKSSNLAIEGFDRHRKENVFTLRLQYQY